MAVGRTTSTLAIPYIGRFLLIHNSIIRVGVFVAHSLIPQENCHSNFHWSLISHLISNF